MKTSEVVRKLCSPQGIGTYVIVTVDDKPLPGWVVKFDASAENPEDEDKSVEKGLHIIHEDGYMRAYFSDLLWEIGSQNPPKRRKKDDDDPILFRLQPDRNISPAEVQAKLDARPNLGGDEVGRRLLAEGANFLGRRIKLWWPGEQTFYLGVAFKFEDGKWHIGFDDGDEGSYDLTQESWTMETTKVIHQDERTAMYIETDALGRPTREVAFVNTCSTLSDTVSVKASINSIVVAVTSPPGAMKKTKPQQYIFVYPRKLKPETATSMVDDEGRVQVSVDIDNSESTEMGER